MKLVWTKSHMPLSILIRGITGEPVSHFAFVFENYPKGLMFQSNLIGTHPVMYKTAQKGLFGMKIIFQKELPVPIELEDRIWDAIVEKYDDRPYDYWGAIYTGFVILNNRIFGVKIPTTNIWADTNKYYCDEIYDILTEFIPELPQIKVSGSCITPFKLWEQINDWSYVQ